MGCTHSRLRLKQEKKQQEPLLEMFNDVSAPDKVYNNGLYTLSA